MGRPGDRLPHASSYCPNLASPDGRACERTCTALKPESIRGPEIGPKTATIPTEPNIHKVMIGDTVVAGVNRAHYPAPASARAHPHRGPRPLRRRPQATPNA